MYWHVLISWLIQFYHFFYKIIKINRGWKIFVLIRSSSTNFITQHQTPSSTSFQGTLPIRSQPSTTPSRRQSILLLSTRQGDTIPTHFHSRTYRGTAKHSYFAIIVACRGGVCALRRSRWKHFYDQQRGISRYKGPELRRNCRCIAFAHPRLHLRDDQQQDFNPIEQRVRPC